MNTSLRERFAVVSRLLLVLAFSIFTLNEASSAGSAADGFDPETTGGDIFDILVLEDGKVLVAGSFTTIGGENRPGIARLNADGSVDTSFNAGTFTGTIQSVALQSDGKIVVGGSFMGIGGASRLNLARLGPNGGLDTGFTVVADSVVLSVKVDSSDQIYVGGFFDEIGVLGSEADRIGFARLSSDGIVDATFDAALNLVGVSAITVQADGKILIGGTFGTVGGFAQNSLARINSDGSPDTGFAPGSIGGAVNAIALHANGDVVVAGSFTTIGGTPRNRMARLNSTGVLDASFDPDLGGSANALAVQANGDILVGGTFTTASPADTMRNRVARFLSDGTLDMDFDPDVGDDVRALAAQSDGKVLIGGDFSAVGGETRERIARVHQDGSVEVDLSITLGAGVNGSVEQPDGKIVIVGAIADKIERLNPDGSFDADFDPDVNNGVIYAVALQRDGKILIGGTFDEVDDGTAHVRNGIARLLPNGDVDTTFNPSVIGGSVNCIIVQPDGNILIGGGFTEIGGDDAIVRLARLEESGAVDTSFSPNPASGSVDAIAIQEDGKILVGGSFFEIGGVARQRIARLDSDGTVEAGFQPEATGNIRAMVVQADGKILAGGAFGMIGGESRNKIARLETDGTADLGFDPHASGGAALSSVNTIALQIDGRILIGGEFGTIGMTARNYIARLETDGTLDLDFDPNASTIVRTIVLQSDGKILVGGDFVTIDGESRDRFARLTNDAGLQDLELDGSTLTWTRSGATSEISETTFVHSSDGGLNWSPLGVGTRVGTSGDWDLSGVGLPAGQSVLIRATGSKLEAGLNGGASLYQSVREFFTPALPPPPVVTPTVDNSAQIASLLKKIKKLKKKAKKVKKKGNKKKAKKLKLKVRKLKVLLSML